MKIIPRIVNGDIDSTKNYPFFASISILNQIPFCGGSYIGKNIVLTAGHCLIKYKDKISNMRVRFRKKNILDQGETFQVAKIRIFPKFNSGLLNNDIGVIFLKGKPSKKNIKPICLPDGKLNELLCKEGNGVCVVGFGATAYQKEVSLFLKKIDINILSNDPKKNPYPDKHIIPSRIFAGSGHKCNCVKDACQGDSGGPLFIEHKGRRFLLGIVSCGLKCGESKYPGIYTKVCFYRNWIKKVTNI